jgi:hypothetical protein
MSYDRQGVDVLKCQRFCPLPDGRGSFIRTQYPAKITTRVVVLTIHVVSRMTG